jgi:hypothetical protein
MGIRACWTFHSVDDSLRGRGWILPASLQRRVCLFLKAPFYAVTGDGQVVVHTS